MHHEYLFLLLSIYVRPAPVASLSHTHTSARARVILLVVREYVSALERVTTVNPISARICLLFFL